MSGKWEGGPLFIKISRGSQKGSNNSAPLGRHKTRPYYWTQIPPWSKRSRSSLKISRPHYVRVIDGKVLV